MISVLQCLWYLIIHKYWVWYFGTVLRVPIEQLIMHDLIKLHPTELRGYIKFHQYKQTRNQALYKALHHHFRHCKHHWNYWTIQLDIEDPLEPYSVYCVPIPDRYIREMIADWTAAGYVKHRYFDLPEYYERKKDTILLHAETREKVERYIEIIQHDNRVKRLRSALPRKNGSVCA